MSKLQFKFDPNQDYQLKAIESVVRLFDGLPEYSRSFELGDEIVPNLPPDMELYESFLRQNLAAVQEENGIEQSMFVEFDDGIMLEGVSNDSHRFPSFTIEMETGTGKTYVYLRTIYELRKQYGFSKFIIVVPSIAIYEGVIKTEEITRSHFRSLYDNETIVLTPYDGEQLSRVRSFATSSTAQILLMTIDAFNKGTNKLYKPNEKLPGGRLPHQFIQETLPIAILDEPQSIDNTEKAKSAIRTLKPLLALRYSATHRVTPNLLYRLTPVEAYRRNLVKKIQVVGLSELENLNRPFLVLEKVSKNSPITATIKTYAYQKGTTHEAEITLRQGENLFDKTKREEHKEGYTVLEINATEGGQYVLFENGVRLSLNDSVAQSRPEIFRSQISETLKQHFLMQAQLRPRGIKVLSLFFIDRVANYTSETGIIRRIFDEEFQKLKRKHPHFKDLNPEDVREAYFAKSKTKKGEEVAVDTQGKDKKERDAEKAAFELIMKDKERLLSFDEPKCFIFAHSALKEGWDSPNVFQICTLNQTASEIKKRQEIGRGLRLPVDQSGARIQDDDVNVLTVVANESYESYADGLQREYIEAGQEAPPKPKKPQSSVATRNDEIFSSEDFRAFWQKLNRKATYRIDLDTEKLIRECTARLDKANFPEPTIVLTKGRFVVTEFSIKLESVSGDVAKLFLEIRDTDDNTASRSFKVKKSTDLAKELKDERLRGYKVMEIDENGVDSRVKFTNEVEITPYKSFSFQTQQGKAPDERTLMKLEDTYSVFNLIDRAARETNLTRPTLNKIFAGMSEKKKVVIFKNPEGFASTFITTVRNAVADHIADRIEFMLDPTGNFDTEELFPPTKNFPQKELIDAGSRGLYDKVQCDSDVETRFVENRLIPDENDVVFYFKFPPKFKLELPKIIGNYNPDWGIVRFQTDRKMKLELVRETKGTTDIEHLQFSSEGWKIKCARKYFAELGIDYRIVDDTIPNWWSKEAFSVTDKLID